MRPERQTDSSPSGTDVGKTTAHTSPWHDAQRKFLSFYPFLAYYPYIEKRDIGLWNHLAVWVFVYHRYQLLNA
jgi:hypothetical protein